MRLIIPEGYEPILGLKETEMTIKMLKEHFENGLASELRLRRVTAPLFVLRNTGLNDNLTGIETPVSFKLPDMHDQEAEVVQSLAKWKRMMLRDYDINIGHGIFTDMNALRPDEEMDNLHSVYVDQWDWERAITVKEKTLKYLKETVKQIYATFRRTEYNVYSIQAGLTPQLPENITFIHAEELYEKYPDLTPKEREDQIAEKYGAVFIIGIGADLPDGKPHDKRAPDYDDWTTETEKGFKGLNGDIVVWNNILKCAFELSSMGIRVDSKQLLHQLELTGDMDRVELLFHRRLIDNELPSAIGGGIGQSRTGMLFLHKAHIGEIQSAIWPGEMVDHCKKSNIHLI